MALRTVILEGATAICEFNKKLTYGRLRAGGLASYSDSKDLSNQGILVQEERTEYQEAGDLVNMLKEAIDMLVTEVWLDVLEVAFHANHDLRTIEEAVPQVLNRYKREPLKLCCVTPFIFLARLGVDVEGAIHAVVADNNTKFTKEVHDTANTVAYYSEQLGVECEARPVDPFHKEWGVFRLPDLKLLKPRSYMKKALAGEGLDLKPFVPVHLRDAKCFPLSAVQGASTIDTWDTRSNN